MSNRSVALSTSIIASIIVGLTLGLIQTTGASAADRKQMIGQMLMMGFTGANPNGSWAKTLTAQIKRGEVGGVVMLGYNFKTKASTEALTRLFRNAAGPRKVFIAVDMEGGAVQRLGRKLGYPAIASAGRTARTQSPAKAKATFSRLAKITKGAGFNMNLGPVVDLLINPKNPVIARHHRSYGKDPKKVEAYARAFVQAHEEQGIITVLKHFPGHGSSRTDSHEGFVDISKTWQPQELDPFANLIKSGDAPAIMPGHLVHNKIASDGVPASISKAAITGLLRGKLKYRGLVVSDDLQMGAIAKNFGYRKTLVRAINAGIDVLMISNSRRPDKNLPRKTIAIIEDAIDKGEISESKIKAAYKRILYAKSRLAH